jgi:hypothetical protein
MTPIEKTLNDLILASREVVKSIKKNEIPSGSSYDRLKIALETLDTQPTDERTAPLRLLFTPGGVLSNFSVEFGSRYHNPRNPSDTIVKKTVDAITHGASSYEMLEALVDVIDKQQAQLAEVLSTLPIGHGSPGTRTIVIKSEQ